MKKGSRFLIGFAAAALAFGSLMAFVGPQHFAKYGNRHCGYHQHHCLNQCSEADLEK